MPLGAFLNDFYITESLRIELLCIERRKTTRRSRPQSRQKLLESIQSLTSAFGACTMWHLSPLKQSFWWKNLLHKRCSRGGVTIRSAGRKNMVCMCVDKCSSAGAIEQPLKPGLFLHRTGAERPRSIGHPRFCCFLWHVPLGLGRVPRATATNSSGTFTPCCGTTWF